MRPSISSRRAWRSIGVQYSIEPLMLGIDRKIVAAVNALERCGAWPEFGDRFQIRISDGGQFETSFGAHSRAWGDESESFSPSHRRIAIGRDFLATTAPLTLIKAGISPDVALTLALGHETFHMTEVDRQSECQIPFKSVASGFARSPQGDVRGMEASGRGSFRPLQIPHENRETIQAGDEQGCVGGKRRGQRGLR